MSDQKQEAIFVGNGKEVTQFEGLFNLNICLSDIPKEHIQKSEKNGKSYVRLNMGKMKAATDWGTHSIKVDTWKPSKPAVTTVTSQPVPPVQPDDLPF